ncbi:hypothetical protein J3F84DRAFT_143464 [Trichoderma pleuroticola]
MEAQRYWLNSEGNMFEQTIVFDLLLFSLPYYIHRIKRCDSRWVGTGVTSLHRRRRIKRHPFQSPLSVSQRVVSYFSAVFFLISIECLGSHFFFFLSLYVDGGGRQAVSELAHGCLRE